MAGEMAPGSDQSLRDVRRGAAPPLVFLHGWGASRHQWRLILPLIAPAGYSLYAPDLLGHGEADKPAATEDYGVEAYLDHLGRWLDQRALSRFLVVAHSLGGYLGLELAWRQPERLAGLVLVNPLYARAQLRRNPLVQALRLPLLGAWLFRHTPEWLIRTGLGFSRYDTPHLPADFRRQVAHDYKRASPHIVHTISSLADLRPRLPQIQAPTLVIWGDRDFTLDPAFFPALVEALPNAQGHCFAGRGHCPHLAEVGRFSGLVLAFAHCQLG